MSLRILEELRENVITKHVVTFSSGLTLICLLQGLLNLLFICQATLPLFSCQVCDIDAAFSCKTVGVESEKEKKKLFFHWKMTDFNGAFVELTSIELGTKNIFLCSQANLCYSKNK